MNISVIGTSRKENEKRVAIHPKHIKNIPKDLRKQLYFEKGYGKPFGVSDERIAFLTENPLMSRSALLTNSNAVIIPKPIEEDFEQMQKGTIVWGWVHSVQHSSIAQIAINKKLTLIAWENMYYHGTRNTMHIFQKNNEMAGYCGVQQTLELRGIDGNFGPPRKATVLGFGSVSRGAISSLMGHGISDITVFTRRPVYLVADKIPGIKYKKIFKDKTGEFVVENQQGESESIVKNLTHADIIVNAILQKPNDPITFIYDNDIIKFRKECLVIDISCDTGMGFSFAHTTDLVHPLHRYGNILYYSVDHTPTLLWDSASWEISNCILPHLKCFAKQAYDDVLSGAIDIKNGVIINKDILTFQNRSNIYPYNKNDIKNKKYANILPLAGVTSN